MDDKLRQQYDLLGIDLDEDEVETNNDHHHDDDGDEHDQQDDADNETNGGKTDKKPDAKKTKKPQPNNETPSIFQELASTVMAAIMQVMVRTGELTYSCIHCTGTMWFAVRQNYRRSLNICCFYLPTQSLWDLSLA